MNLANPRRPSGGGDFAHMDWFLAGPATACTGSAFVIYRGDRILSFGPGKLALPLSMLWSCR
jgi:hypothetical protein